MPYFEDNPEESYCDCCNFETTKLNKYLIEAPSKRKGQEVWCCDLCFTTFGSSYYAYPDQVTLVKVVNHISLVGNLILEEIKKNKQ
ncbi:hypothetical protein M0R19_05390 [Candidatus Pacearchaeota archaeon]|nr:hypothetical protein [Candidatus Pacearchaeota archaeon]